MHEAVIRRYQRAGISFGTGVPRAPRTSVRTIMSKNVMCTTRRRR